MKKQKYLTCDKCGYEINPTLWDGCDKYYVVGNEVYCADCFKDWVLEWVEGDLDEVARVLDVPAVEVSV